MCADKIILIPEKRTNQECPWCEGAGKHSWGDPSQPLERCSFCDGTGYLDLTTYLAIQEGYGNGRHADHN